MVRYKIPVFNEIVSLVYLFDSWNEFRQNKKNKSDVTIFSTKLVANLLRLEQELKSDLYQHGPYYHFKISDPKPRDIHKASVRDRVVHHALYRALYPHFASRFIFDSYSCQLNKGTHRALDRLNILAARCSRNYSLPLWVLKGDIKKCFASIDQATLKSILVRQVKDRQTSGLIEKVIDSFPKGKQGVGIPLGNLTSQLFVNIYLNEFDQFMKHQLKTKYYIRYADDFVVLGRDRAGLENLISPIAQFLETELKLTLHPQKIYLKSFSSGIDFLGWVHFLKYRTLRTVTKKRMLKRIDVRPTLETINSYLGLLKHGNAYKLTEGIRDKYQIKT